MVEQITFFKTDLPSDLLRTIQQRHQVATLLIGDEGFGKSRILSGLTNKLSDLHIMYESDSVRIRPFQENALIQYIAKESGDEILHNLWKQ